MSRVPAEADPVCYCCSFIWAEEGVVGVFPRLSRPRAEGLNQGEA